MSDEQARQASGIPVVGMVGAGQLARMTYQASIPLGVGFRVLADRPDDSAALVCPDTTVGDYHRLDDLLGFAAGCDVVTFDHEHVPGEHLAALAGGRGGRGAGRRPRSGTPRTSWPCGTS